MGASKSDTRGAVHREARNDDAASSSSAILLDNVDRYDEEDGEGQEEDDLPPAYDADEISEAQGRNDGVAFWDWSPPPTPPFSNHDWNKVSFWTLLPSYSSDPDLLYNLIMEQAFYPPTYCVEIHGTHMEKRAGKDQKDRVTDFLFKINLSTLLRRDGQTANDVLEFLPINKRGYRGTRFPSMRPVIGDDVEATGSIESALRAWCTHYVSSRSPVKSFSLHRRVTNHDTTTLRQVIIGAIQSTGYLGHTTVRFPMQHQSITVYSPGIINTMRTTIWVRYLFYFTFLWILSWPILILCTARYEVVEAVWEYADRMPGAGEEGEFARERDRRCVVMSEGEWFKRWQNAIRKAAVGKMKCGGEFLGEEYRRQAEDMASRAQELNMLRNFIPRRGNGNHHSDHLLNLVEEGIAFATVNSSSGWGGDT